MDANAYESIAQELGYATTRKPGSVTVHTSDDTFIEIDTKQNTAWGSFADYSSHSYDLNEFKEWIRFQEDLYSFKD